MLKSFDKTFQSTPSVWRETGLTKSCGHRRNISIHSLRVEGDGSDSDMLALLLYFNPLPPCGGRLFPLLIPLAFFGISIHSLRVEGDSSPPQARLVPPHFNPLPPCGGRHYLLATMPESAVFQSTPSVWRETFLAAISVVPDVFQSTPSVWRETPALLCRRTRDWHFNPLPPCGGRLLTHSARCTEKHFNPLPPCGGRPCNARPCYVPVVYFNPLPPCGGRQSAQYNRFKEAIFQSTPSVWRETMKNGAVTKSRPFQSTPSVWRETVSAVVSVAMSDHFNPLPPCGGRHGAAKDADQLAAFQSTPSVWRETAKLATETGLSVISIHSLRVEGDLQTAGAVGCTQYFNPLPPCGGRHCPAASARLATISIHSLRVEGDGGAGCPQRAGCHFNPLPPCGGRLPLMIVRASASDFNPLPPCGGRLDTVSKIANHIQFQSTPSVWRETHVARRADAAGQCISIHSLRVEGDPRGTV